MLQYLKIRNLALIESAEIDLSSGFTAVTGETGAGKSILLGALMLLSGSRSDKTQIKKKADFCEVEAVLHFSDPAIINKYLESFGLPLCEEGALLLKRTVFREKAARIYINNALGTQAALQRLGECWVDFHGPGEHQRLFRDRFQLEVLDLYSKTNNILSDYQAGYREWMQCMSEIDELLRAEKLSEDDIYFLNSQIESIDKVEPDADSIEQLERDYKRLSNISDISNLVGGIQTSLQGDGGVIEKLAELSRQAQELAELDAGTSVLSDRVNASIIELEDLVQEYSSLAGDTEFDEEVIKSITDRMNLWLDLKRRYGPDVQQVIDKREALAHKLATQADVEGSIKALEEKAKNLEKVLLEKADKLHKTRVKGAKSLCRKVSKSLLSLGFQQAVVDIEFTSDGKLHEYGNRKCAFMFQPNKGEDTLPLNKIASSGELARVMLAVKTILAELDRVPVLVFDEVDANVGGEVGARVGEELSSLGARHQVICVTHLPQVAAQAENHYLITKIQGKKTDVLISALHQNEEQRLAEISRMIGDRSSASVLKHAEELLKR